MIPTVTKIVLKWDKDPVRYKTFGILEQKLVHPVSAVMVCFAKMKSQDYQTIMKPNVSEGIVSNKIKNESCGFFFIYFYFFKVQELNIDHLSIRNRM